MGKVDMSKYAIRTDLAIEALEVTKVGDDFKTEEETVRGVKITRVDIIGDVIDLINKKKGRYITIEFDDITDTNEKEDVKKSLVMNLRVCYLI